MGYTTLSLSGYSDLQPIGQNFGSSIASQPAVDVNNLKATVPAKGFWSTAGDVLTGIASIAQPVAQTYIAVKNAQATQQATKNTAVTVTPSVINNPQPLTVQGGAALVPGADSSSGIGAFFSKLIPFINTGVAYAGEIKSLNTSQAVNTQRELNQKPDYSGLILILGLAAAIYFARK